MMNTPSGAKKHHESTEPESRQTAKMFFFFRWASSNLCYFHDWFSHKTPAFFTKQCTTPSLSSMFEVTRGDTNRSLKNYGFHYVASIMTPFFSSHVRMCTNHLATKCNYYGILLNAVGVHGVIEESLVWSVILEPILHRCQELYPKGRGSSNVVWTPSKCAEKLEVGSREGSSMEAKETTKQPIRAGDILLLQRLWWTNWIACDHCECWFHFLCVGVELGNVPDSFLCSSCA